MHTPLLMSLIAFCLSGCTFAVKNDEGDTAAEVSEFDDIEVTDLDRCDGDQLQFGIEMRDQSGNIITSASPGSRNELWGTIGNICKNTIEYQTDTQCLIELWSIVGGGFSQQNHVFLCDPTTQDRSLQSGKVLRRLISPLNDLSEGTYNITVDFSFTSSDGAKAQEEATLQISEE